MPSRSISVASSGTLLTWSDQLQTPMDNGASAMHFHLSSGFDGHAQRAQLTAIGVDFMEGADLLGFQFGDFLGAGPNDGPALGVAPRASFGKWRWSLNPSALRRTSTTN